MKEDNKMKHTMRILTFLMLAIVAGAGQVWADALSNPRVKFVYESEHGYAFASDADNEGNVTITVTPEGDWRCIDGDLTAQVSSSSDKAETPRRAPELGQSVGVTIVSTNVFTLTLPEEETLNVTVYVKFSEKLTFTPTVSIVGWTYGDDPNVPSLESNTSGGGVTYTYADTNDGTYDTTVPTQAGLFWVKATVAATADYKACVSAPFEFEIEKKDLTVTANNHTINYGEAPANNGVTYGDFVEGDGVNNLFGTLDYSYTYSQYGPVGNYVITPSGLYSDNYNIILEDGTLTVNPKTITITAEDISKTYDGTTAVQPHFTFQGGAILGSDDVSIDASGASAEFENKDVGTGKVVTVTGLALAGADMNNYDLTNPYFTTAGSITKKDLTITANDHTIDYGEEPDNGGVTYDGFVNGENENTSNIFGGSTLTYAYNTQAYGLGTSYTTSSPVGNYYIIPSGLTSNNYNITYVSGTLTVNQKATISVEWDDNEDLGDLRPGSLEFKLLADGSDADPECKVTLNSENGWSVTVNGLTAYNGETLIPYTWSLETPPDIVYNDYELGDAPQSTSTTGATARFTYTRKTGSLTVTNTVVSDLAADANKAFTYTVKLTNANINGTYSDMTFTDGVATFTLTGQTDNKTKTADLMYGTTYTVTQTPVDGFIIGKTGDTGTISTTTSEAEFTNTRETGDLKVTNTVVSDLAADATVEFTFTVSLADDNISGTYGDMTFTDGGATVTLKGGESKTATGLPTDLTYTVTQADAPGFVTTGKTGDTGTISTTTSEAEFTNTRETGDLTVTNTVYPSNDDTAFEFTVTLNKVITNRTYGGMDFQDGVATFQLRNGQTVEATGLPTTVEYTVTQTANNDFSTTKTDDTGTISATLSEAAFKNIMLTDARFDIDWRDGGNTSSRPTGLTTALLSKLANYEGEPQPVPGQDKTLNSTNDWHASVPNLPMYNEEGSLIIYSWREIESVPSGYLLTDYLTGKDASYTYILKTSATVTISWDDANDQDGKRPTEMSARLSNGTDATLNSANSWTATVEDLPKYDNNDIAIDYNWTPGALPDDYTMSDLSKADIVTTITLSHTLEKTQVSVKAIWSDNNNVEGFRPESVTVKLLADGNEANSVTLNADNEWNYTWTGLDKYANGTEITYTVSQTQLANYEVPAIAKTSETGWAYSVTNSRDYEETEVKVSKVWEDNNNEEGFRTASVTVRLKKGDEVIGSVELNANNSWEYTWSNLQKYENGTAINYTVTEDPVANYSTQITKADETFTYTVTNSRTVEETEVNVSMFWNDNNDNDRKRPSSVTVKLLANGNEANTATLNEDNEWKYTWADLNKYAGGAEITYTISQEQLANYKVPVIEKVSETEWKYTVTNSHDLEVTEATVKVVWVDANDELHNRPASVTATLWADGTATENTVTMNAGNDWTATVTVQKYSNATPIVYTWTQDVNALPEGYKQTNSAVAGAVTTFTDSYYPAVTVTITGHNIETTYDGTEHVVSGYEVTNISYSLYTEADFTFNGTAQASRTDVGTTNMGLTPADFTNINNNFNVTFDVTDGYVTVSYHLAELTDNADNTAAISEILTSHGGKADVKLSGHKFYKDGAWNTLTLPFAISEFTGTPLEGATVKELDVDDKWIMENDQWSIDNENGTYQTGLDGSTLYLYFKDATSIVAGKPYIVKWAKPDGYNNNPSAYDIVSPVFTGVTVDKSNNDVDFTGGKFMGNYAPLEITVTGDNPNCNDYVVLAGNNRLGYVTTDRTVANGKALGAFHAYFYIPANGGSPAASSFEMNTDNDETTSLSEELRVKSEEFATATDWYTLDGRKLQGKPTQKGLYIYKGKKVKR